MEMSNLSFVFSELSILKDQVSELTKTINLLKAHSVCCSPMLNCHIHAVKILPQPKVITRNIQVISLDEYKNIPEVEEKSNIQKILNDKEISFIASQRLNVENEEEKNYTHEHKQKQMYKAIPKKSNRNYAEENSKNTNYIPHLRPEIRKPEPATATFIPPVDPTKVFKKKHSKNFIPSGMDEVEEPVSVETKAEEPEEEEEEVESNLIIDDAEGWCGSGDGDGDDDCNGEADGYAEAEEGPTDRELANINNIPSAADDIHIPLECSLLDKPTPVLKEMCKDKNYKGHTSITAKVDLVKFMAEEDHSAAITPVLRVKTPSLEERKALATADELNHEEKNFTPDAEEKKEKKEKKDAIPSDCHLLVKTIKELKEICKTRHFKGYASIKHKTSLIQFILDQEIKAEEEPPTLGGEEEVKYTKEDLTKMPVKDLKQLCKNRHITGYSKCKNHNEYVMFILERI